MELIKCRHCGRMFGEKAIDKHEGVCLKVFQQKRKAFNSAAQRGPEVEIELASTKNNTKKPVAKSKIGVQKEEAIGGMPKWKIQSLQFRASLKQN